MNENRLKQLINNILYEITVASEMPKEKYLSWLKLEVGFTEEELQELADDGLLPLPTEIEKSLD